VKTSVIFETKGSKKPECELTHPGTPRREKTTKQKKNLCLLGLNFLIGLSSDEATLDRFHIGTHFCIY
jgi:hypothetical protein